MIARSDGSSPSVSIPYSESTTIKTLRAMLRRRDRALSMWHPPEFRYKADQERRMIRERIKELAAVSRLTREE